MTPDVTEPHSAFAPRLVYLGLTETGAVKTGLEYTLPLAILGEKSMVGYQNQMFPPQTQAIYGFERPYAFRAT